MQRSLFIALLAFVVTLAVIIGFRMSAEAMAVVIGVIFGLAAGLSASLLIASFTYREEPLVVHSRADRREVSREPGPVASPYPQAPVIIVNPSPSGASGWLPYGQGALPAIPPAATSPRRGPRVIGEEAEEERGW